MMLDTLKVLTYFDCYKKLTYSLKNHIEGITPWQKKITIKYSV
jgi:hypothetical protein